MISLAIEVLTAVVAIFLIKTLDVSPLHAAGGMGVIAVLASLKNYVFEQRPIKLILINESYKLVCYLVVGIIALFA
ncbi:membrane protein [Streptococcus suis]|uniref:Membrane protein n=1 Tax=Streptococcus suis TaxID=1307 RepID=A0A0Z8XFI4_STRSU|nr:membrane protein [Streptococcus suis]CYX92000.1 membrane protein [Streptococcus suis]